MRPIDNLEAVEEILQNLMSREPPLVIRLSRQPGRKEHRFAHLLSGPVEEPEPAETPAATAGPDRLEQLQTEVDILRSELQELREAFDDFRKQFD